MGIDSAPTPTSNRPSLEAIAAYAKASGFGGFGVAISVAVLAMAALEKNWGTIVGPTCGDGQSDTPTVTG